MTDTEPIDEQAILNFSADTDSSNEELRRKATTLLTPPGAVLQILEGMGQGDQTNFLDKAYEVRHDISPFRAPRLITSAKAYDIIDTPPSQDAECLIALGGICSALVLLPTSAVLPRIEECEKSPFRPGSNSTLWRGKLKDTSVAIKVIHVGNTAGLNSIKEVGKKNQHSRFVHERKLQNLWKWVPLWKKLFNPHILPFRGVEMVTHKISLVYDWCENGNIIKYIFSHPDANRPMLVGKFL